MVQILKEKEKEIVVNAGGFGYTAEQMSSILDIPVEDIQDWMMDSKSEFMRAYQQGVHKYEYVLDMKLMEMIQSGDLKALEKLEARKTKRRKEAES